MTTNEMTPQRSDSVKRWRDMLASERDAAALYTRLADAERSESQLSESEVSS